MNEEPGLISMEREYRGFSDFCEWFFRAIEKPTETKSGSYVSMNQTDFC
jgi:hypothetical protein